MVSTKWANSLRGRWFFFGLSILINAFFNALTVSTNMGSGIWTASAVSLSKWTSWQLGNILFLEGITVAFANLILLGRFDYFRLIRNLIFITPFSYLLAGFEVIFVHLDIAHLSLPYLGGACSI